MGKIKHLEHVLANAFPVLFVNSQKPAIRQIIGKKKAARSGKEGCPVIAELPSLGCHGQGVSPL